ncbi:MAG: hypothetical protein M3458_22485, partial [Acidobacteriota bacterium]|nr:hypothetical protein [Acidobacteriota bacterium]
LPGATPFEQRVLAEFAALRQQVGTVGQEVATLRQEVGALRQDVGVLRQEVSTLSTRLTALEDKVDERLRETRPIWEGVLVRLTAIEGAIKEIRSQMKVFVEDLFYTPACVKDLEDQRQPPVA